jgi:hypothetical protein
LIIDDECDQASVNSAKDDYDPTKINEAIRKIINSLPAVSYVGYTATPFANVFINPFSRNKDELDDLYPEDFITSLPKPSSYFGPEEVFGLEPADAENETESEMGRDMIRKIPDGELVDLVVRKASEKESFNPKLTDSLRSAIHWFLASCAIRIARGHENKHMTMLVHTSPYVSQHKSMADAIRDYLRDADMSVVSGEIAALVEEEYKRVPSDKRDYLRPSPEEVGHGATGIARRLNVVVENGESFERLDFTGDPKIYIVVGGAVLARGLTLEGLSVSFFLRTSRQYDTLLQMGRWFGYRSGYEDLPRLWTTDDLASSFRAMAHIEAEIREEIEFYRKREVTPLDFAIRVRSIPGMAITSATKMRHAYRTSISFEGRHVQTIRFDHKNEDVVVGNWKAASRLVEGIGADTFSRRSQGFLAEAVPGDMVRQFLASYDISSHHMDLRKDHVLGFVDQRRDQWPAWNIVIVQSEKGELSLQPLGVLGKVATVRRSRLRELAGGHADIKALMSKTDILVDAKGSVSDRRELGWEDFKACRPDDVPLLLIYPVNAVSAPRKQNGKRIELGAVGDLIGIGIVFPGQIDRSGNYFAVELAVPTPEQLDEEEVVEDDEAELINDPSP